MVNFGDNQKYILKLLQKKKLITGEQIKIAELTSDTELIGIVDAIEKLNIITEENILMVLASDLGMEYVNLGSQQIESEAIGKISYKQAKEYNIMPLRMDFDSVIVATNRPLDLANLDNLSTLIGSPIESVISSSKEISLIIEDLYQGGMKETQDNSSNEIDNKSVENNFLNQLSNDNASMDADDAPIIKMVSSIIIEAYRMKASDIHLEPMEKSFRIRYRIDGVLVEIKNHPKQLQAPVLSRIKLLSNMKLAEKRLPQDGKIQVSIQKKSIDIRVSTLPGTYGESVVLRILDKSGLKLGLASLGFLSDTEKGWNKLISFTNGVILITGPTGSGKTTTLYSCLNSLNTSECKIITVEDPIEYQLGGINQVQVREDIDLTFSSVLRACLRQAPNIIMVGEIRDHETAQIAMNAAFTGHLVFSTLHTNDAPGAITRLIDQGIEPFLVSSAIRGILAQRLVRAICTECKEAYTPNQEVIKILNIKKSQKVPDLYKGKGCLHCNGTGYKGRFGIFELLVMTPDIQELIYEKKSSAEIRDLAIQNGMRTLRDDAILKVLNGSTTVEELLRVTKIGEI